MNMRLVRLTTLCVLSVSCSLPIGSQVKADLPEAPVVPGEVLVGFRPARAGGGLDSAGVSAALRLGDIAGFNSRLSAGRVKLRPGMSMAAAIAYLRGQPGVSYAEPNHVMHACAEPNDPDYKSWQYAPQIIKADLAWDIWKPRSQIVLAVVDTGVQASHPDLTDIVARDANGNVIGWNTLNNTANFADDGGHGTHCAGVALAHINNGTGPAGIAGWNPNVPNSDKYVKLMPIKALTAAGNGTDASVAAGITWAADNGAKVISVSASSTSASTTLSNAITYAWNKGCVLIAAAGNDASTAPEYPAAYPNVISVAATDETDTLLFYSQYGSWIKCAAPGTNVFSTYLNSTYSGMSGTSTAAPHVAAEAAAIMSQNPTLNNAQVNALICSQVDPVLPYQGQSLGTGAGRINIFKALSAAGDGLPNLTTISFNPGTIPNAKTTTGTVQIGGPAPAGGILVALTSSDTSIVTVPATVSIPAGETSIAFTVTAKLVDANSTATITASASGKSVSGDVQVRGSIVSALTSNPASVGSKNSFVGTVTLDAPAPSTGGVVTLSDNSGGLVSMPATVTVPAGATSTTFNASVGSVTRRTSVTLEADLNGASVFATLLVNPLQISSIVLNPTTVLGGATSAGSITLSGAAPDGGMTVYLTSSLTAAATVPFTVTVPAGTTTAAFTVTTYSVTVAKNVTITGTAGGVAKTAALKVSPLLLSFTVAPTSVTGGATAVGKITLVTAVPAGAAVNISLSSSSPAVTVPSTVSVAGGSTSVTFNITTTVVTANVAATLTASSSGAKLTAKLTVKPPALSRIALSPTSVKGGVGTTATVALTGPAPSGGTVVTLSSNNVNATVPSTITIPAGASTAQVPVTTSVVTAKTAATISAVSGSLTKTAILTINP